MARLDYSRERIADLVFNYDNLHDYKLADASDEHHYVIGVLGKVQQRAPFETSVVNKVDLDTAILKLSAWEKFILLATVYEGLAGVEYFCDWLDSSPESMLRHRDDVLDKMVRFMNRGVERRGGDHGGGRHKKNQTKKNRF